MKLITLSRRKLLEAGGAIGLSALAETIFSQANALEWQKQTQRNRAEIFKQDLGPFEITIIKDGEFNLPDMQFFPAARFNSGSSDILASRLIPLPGNCHSNVCLIETGNRRMIVGGGTGSTHGRKAGHLAGKMQSLGIDKNTIDYVFVTHAHPEQIAGLIKQETGRLIFPNARHFISLEEWNYWADRELPARLSKSCAPIAFHARNCLMSLMSNIVLVDGPKEILPGIFWMETPGHTPGHASILISSENKKLLVTGDVLPNHKACLSQFDIELTSDHDPHLAAKTRLSVLNYAAVSNTLIFASQLSFPGLGFVQKRRSGGFVWASVDIASYQADQLNLSG